MVKVKTTEQATPSKRVKKTSQQSVPENQVVPEKVVTQEEATPQVSVTTAVGSKLSEFEANAEFFRDNLKPTKIIPSNILVMSTHLSQNAELLKKLMNNLTVNHY